VLGSIAFLGALYLAALFFQDGLGLSALQSGLTPGEIFGPRARRELDKLSLAVLCGEMTRVPLRRRDAAVAHASDRCGRRCPARGFAPIAG
jgi:hypothetical protein